jgi:hypothetical protein
MDLLPQMGTEDLDERDLQRRNLSVHEDTSQIELNLETDVDVGSIDRRRPPHREPSIGDLGQTRSLGISLVVSMAPRKKKEKEENLPIFCISSIPKSSASILSF